MHKEPDAPEADYWQAKIKACKTLEQFYSVGREFKPWLKKYALSYLESEIMPYFREKKPELIK